MSIVIAVITNILDIKGCYQQIRILILMRDLLHLCFQIRTIGMLGRLLLHFSPSQLGIVTEDQTPQAQVVHP